jgi:hypothetical protein
MNVYARELGALGDGPLSRPGLSIRTATPDDTRRWFELSGAGGDWAEPDGVTFMTIRCTLKSDTQLFLAWLDGRPVCGGGLETHDGVAALMAGRTLPAYRNRGIHARCCAGWRGPRQWVGAGVVHSRPAPISQRNILRRIIARESGYGPAVTGSSRPPDWPGHANPILHYVDGYRPVAAHPPIPC